MLRERLAKAPPRAEPLTRLGFLRFYVPLALTPLMTLIAQPIGAAAMNRMPDVLESTAAWPGVHGLVFLTRSAPLAFNEVVVALLGAPGGRRASRGRRGGNRDSRARSPRRSAPCREGQPDGSSTGVR